MTKTKDYWSLYYEKPLDTIPWQRTQADWFKELIDKKRIKGKSALDLGCGTGSKSVYLSQNGFEKVVGVDISEKAISYAKANAKNAKVDKSCQFYKGDVLKLTNFLPKQEFDLILDWALVHCILKDDQRRYSKIINKYSKKGTYLIIRTLTTTGKKTSFEEEIDGATQTISLFRKKDIANLFPEFEVITTNKSKPRTKTEYGFLELLLKKV